MSNWLNSLSSRERILVTYGSIAVLIVLLFLLVIKPLYNNQIQLKKAITQQESTLATMQKQSLEIKQLQELGEISPQNARSQNPQQVIERSLQTWQLKTNLDRMQSQGSNGVRLILKDANADRVMHFLHELENKNSLLINNMAIDRDNKKAGFADFRLTIQGSSQ